MNRFTKTFAQDINIIAKQIDYLSANVVNVFNMFNSEVEQENNFVNRIKNKVKVLQMYSSAPANDIFYFGGSFDSNDYVNFAKIENKDYLPLIENGAMTLPVISVKVWNPRRVVIDEANSNGVEGNNHAVYSTAVEEGESFRYFFRDVQDVRNKNNIIDNNPLKYYEYEQINVLSKTSGSQDFEFKYLLSSSNSAEQTTIDWSTFTAEPLKLTLEFDSNSSAKANYVNITPYFGSANYISRDIIVKKIEVTDAKDEVEDILQGNQIYISSSFIPSSIESSKNFYYREANIKFSERSVKKFKIFLEQIDSTPVTIQHLYFVPEVSLSDTQNPYRGQTRFNPYAPSVAANSNSDIPWSQEIGFNLSSIIPLSNNPNSFKAEAGQSVNTITVPISLQRQVPNASGKTVKFSVPNDSDFYITSNFFTKYNTIDNQGIISGYSGISNSNSDLYVTKILPNTGNINSGFIAELSDSIAILQGIVDWFGNSVQATPEEKLAKFNLPVGSTVSVVDAKSVDTSPDKFNKNIVLNRRYEQKDALRRSISIRDISFGLEEYGDYAQMVSRKFDLSSEIEYITMSSEFKYSGELSSSNQDLIRYYISVDEGSSWKRISPIENAFNGIPEVLAFNQNIDQTFRLPGIEYFNQPAIPSSIKGFLIKIEIFKSTGENITPMIYSYKVGAKVRQL